MQFEGEFAHQVSLDHGDTFTTGAAILCLYGIMGVLVFPRSSHGSSIYLIHHCKIWIEYEMSFQVIVNLATWVHFQGMKLVFYLEVMNENVIFLFQTRTFLLIIYLKRD